jgi:hypothetical protein
MKTLYLRIYLEKRIDEQNKQIKEIVIESSGVFNYDEQYLGGEYRFKNENDDIRC